MAVFSLTSATILCGVAWTGTAPGDPGTQTVSGTVSSSTNISTMVSEIEIGVAAEELEYTNFGSGGWKQKIGSGLKDGSVRLTFNQDFAASTVDSLFGLGGTFAFGAAGGFYIDVKPTSAARGVTNPSHVAQVLNVNYTPLSGAAGALVTMNLTFPSTGQIARLTS